MSLATEEVEQEQNEMKDLQRQLKETTNLVKNLSSQLNDLREKVANELCIVYVVVVGGGGGGRGWRLSETK